MSKIVPQFFMQVFSINYALWILRNNLKAQYVNKTAVLNHLISNLISVEFVKNFGTSMKK